MNKLRVILESPFKATASHSVADHVAYARRALEHSLKLGESPIAFHLLYPQVLNDQNQKERELGLRASWKWISVADAMVVYTDYGVSSAMQSAINIALNLPIPVLYRTIVSQPDANS